MRSFPNISSILKAVLSSVHFVVEVDNLLPGNTDTASLLVSTTSKEINMEQNCDEFMS